MARNECTRAGRIVHGDLQTAVQEYRNPNGRSVLLVSCLHMAEPDYYKQLRKIVEDAEAGGATVLMEGKAEPDNAGINTGDDNLSAEESDAIDANYRAQKDGYIALPQVLDLPWVYQGESALAPYPDTWRGSDVPVLHMIRLGGPQHAAGWIPSATRMHETRRLKESKGAHSQAFRFRRLTFAKVYFNDFRQIGWVERVCRRMIDRVRRGITGAVRLLTRKPAPVGTMWMLPYVYTYRECVAALSALAIEGDVVLVWHPLHMRGIGQILARNGFEPQEPRHWLTACHRVRDVTRPRA